MSAINYHISQTDWIKYTKQCPRVLKLVVSVLKLYLYKCFLGHGMDQIQRATLSLAICVFSAVTFVLIFFFFVGFSGGFRAS